MGWVRHGGCQLCYIVRLHGLFTYLLRPIILPIQESMLGKTIIELL
jgi:hypothetical protein